MPWPKPEYKKDWTTRDFIKASLIHVKGSVLDYGAGTQKYRKLIEAAIPDGAYKAFDVAAVPGIDFVGDVHDSKLEADRFDTVICNQVLEHTEDPAQVVIEMARICKTGGNLILSVPFMIGFHPCPQDFYRFTHQGVEQLCKEHFEPIYLTAYGGLAQILTSSDDFAREYSYENFLRIKQPPKMGLARKASRKMMNGVYSILETIHPFPAIYSNLGFVLKKK